MKKIENSFLFFLILTISMTIAISYQIFAENIIIASFNVLRLGDNSKDYETTAKVISKFDLIGLEEVMNEKGLKKLKAKLESNTKIKWDYIISEKPVGSKDYKEYYAFIYKKDKFQVATSLNTFKESNKNMFIREPFAAKFKSNNFDFVYIICHSIFGDNEKNRILEASNYSKVYSYYSDIVPNEDDIIIAGDFNLPANDMAFQSLIEQNNLSYIINPNWFKTTLSDKGLSSSYDNIFINRERTLEYTGRYGVYNYTKNNYKILRKWISDHLPIFIEVDNILDLDYKTS